MAVTYVVNSLGQIGIVRADTTIIQFTIAATATVYATASGGLPIDISAVLNATGSDNQPFINPLNVYDAFATNFSTNGYFPCGFTFSAANVTYNSNAFPYSGQTSPSVRPAYSSVATAPATIRLRGIGASAANHAAFGEVADGAVTDGFTLYLMITKGGTNS